MQDEYDLRYLPLFYEDLLDKVNYIRNELQNPQAAYNLIDDVEEAILSRLPICESFEPFPSSRKREYPYYRIYVKNFIVFYVVIHQEDRRIMEVRRFLYGGQDRSNLLE